MFKVKQLQRDEFYPTFCKWLYEHDFPEISDLILPENVFVCSIDDMPSYAIWFYFTDSKALAWLGWPISNKKVNFNKREGGMEFLLEYISNYAKKKKIKMLITTSSTEKFVNSLVRNGFNTADKNVDQFIKII